MHSIKKNVPIAYRKRYHSIRSQWVSLTQGLGTEFKILGARIRRLFLPIPHPKLENGQINLHLGCGPINHPKFINVDGLPAPHVHYIRPLNDLSCFDDNTVDLIYASHCLEHFSHLKIHEVLSEWFRVLKKGGILRLSVPDFDLLLEIYQDSGKNIYTILTGLMGGQDYKYNFHMVVFNKSSLNSLLEEFDFKEVSEWHPGSCELTTFDDHSICEFKVNKKKYPVSLNLQAVK